MGYAKKMPGIDVVTLVAFTGTLVFAAHFFAWLFSQTKIPDALLLLMVGLLVGPVLGWIGPNYLGQATELIVTLVLIVLLWQGGLNLRWGDLRAAWRGSLRLTGASFAATMALVAAGLQLVFGFEPLMALAAGAILGGTSSAIVIPLLKRLELSDEGETMLTLESVGSDVLAIVLTLALLDAKENGVLSLPAIAYDLLFSFLGAAILGVAVALLWARLLAVVRTVRNSLFTTPALVFVVFGAAESLGLNGLIAVLAFGVLLGNVPELNRRLEQRHIFWRYLVRAESLSRREKLFFEELAFLLQTFFFVFVGYSLRFEGLGPLLAGLGLVPLMLAARWIVVRIVARRVPAATGKIMGIMIPKGLAAAALATLVAQRGLEAGAFLQDLTYAVIVLSVAATSLLIFIVHRQKPGPLVWSEDARVARS